MTGSHAPGLRDVARVAGVHVSTASRALNPRTQAMVSPETLERVREAVAALGYQMNGTARALKTHRTYTVGMLIPDILNPFFPPIVRGAEDVLAEAGYALMLANTDNDERKYSRQLHAMLGWRVDGMLLATARRQDSLIGELRRRGVPSVLVNRVPDRGDVSAVVPDDERGVSLAVEHLYRLGHRRIGHVAGPSDNSNGVRRAAGFARAARALNVPVASMVDTTGFNEEEGRRAALKLLSGTLAPTGIFAANDVLAIGVLEAVRELSLSCPADVSVVGFNNMRYLDLLQPPLTTVHVGEYDLGRKAAELLLATMLEPGRSPETLTVATRLVLRGSTARPPTALLPSTAT